MVVEMKSQCFCSKGLNRSFMALILEVAVVAVITAWEAV